jgi:hypothetical protein
MRFNRVIESDARRGRARFIADVNASTQKGKSCLW